MRMIEEAARLRRRARTCRDLAAGMAAGRGRELMIESAADYEQRAAVLDRQSRGTKG
jgi:hypothetical protein